MIVSRIQSVFYIIVATKLVVVNGKTIHTITVGAAGRTIEPPFLVVEMDDIVTFVLSGYFHTVTQSTFENPLVPLSGGFNSGMAIRDIDGSISVRTWDLRITDNLHPIWFFCKGSQQPSNCTEGIVGSINPPNQTIYNVFASAGNQNSCSLTPTPTASSPSIVIPTSIHEVSSVIPSSTRVSFADDAPTGTPPTMAVPDSGHRRRGAIIGGVIGGVLGLILLLLAVYLCWWRRRRSRSGADRDGANPFQTHESKIESTMLNLRPEVTTLPPSASSDKHAPSQLNADRPKIGILDSPSFSPLGVQQPQSQPGPQQRHDPTNVVYATYPKAKVGQQADAASSPFTISSSAPDKSGPALREVDPLQQSESPPIPAVFTSAPESEKQGPTFIEGSTEAEQEELPPSTYRTPMGARLRQVRRAEEAHPEYGTVIGIDLGTSYSRVGVQRGGTFQIIPNEQGQRATRSSVCFTGKKRLVGDFSNDFNPNNTVFAIKRLIGRKMDDLDVIRDMKQFPFKVTGKNGAPTVTVKINGRERSFTPEEITATVITRMKETAEAHLGHKVTHAVVTVPACFNDAQRQATKDAGKIAGLDIIRILNEPTAAAIAYGLDKKGVSRVLVYDLGGGFFDVSLLSIDDGVFEVLATAGDTRLGGEDFDNRVMEHFIQLYKTKTGTDVSQNIFALAKLKSKVERAKRILSSEQSARVEIRSFENGNDFSQTLTRATFEELNIDLFNKTIRLVEKVLKDANCKKGEVDEVLLIGGSSHIPRVQQLLNGIFSGKERSNEADSDDSIVHGAAIQGGILSGTETAADIILVDVCPRSLGIETIGEVFSILIPRNSEIPTKKSGIYTTAFDNQRVVSIKVFEGEHVQTKYNNLLGRFELTGIPPAPSGVPQIKVTFAIDADGIMQVRASDLGTGNTNSIRIVTNKGRLSKVEIMRMLTETAAEG